MALVITGSPRWPDLTRRRDFAGSVGGEADTIKREVFMRVRHTIHPRSCFGRSDRSALRLAGANCLCWAARLLSRPKCRPTNPVRSGGGDP